MQRSNDLLTMNTNVLVGVIAYGFRPDLTVIVKQPFLFREMSSVNMSSRFSGFADTGLLVKYKLYRRNTASYIFGLATTVEAKAPTGNSKFSNGLWDAKPGFYASLRLGKWASDIAAAYSFNGLDGPTYDGLAPGDELSLDWAISRQISMGQFAQSSLAPVIEMSFIKTFQDNLDGQFVESEESVLFLSPGFKLTMSSFIFEVLYRHALTQKQNGMMLTRGPFALVGMRYMF